jgi:hypothetical protein
MYGTRCSIPGEVQLGSDGRLYWPTEDAGLHGNLLAEDSKDPEFTGVGRWKVQANEVRFFRLYCPTWNYS